MSTVIGPVVADSIDAPSRKQRLAFQRTYDIVAHLSINGQSYSPSEYTNLAGIDGKRGAAVRVLFDICEPNLESRITIVQTALQPEAFRKKQKFTAYLAIPCDRIIPESYSLVPCVDAEVPDGIVLLAGFDPVDEAYLSFTVSKKQPLPLTVKKVPKLQTHQARELLEGLIGEVRRCKLNSLEMRIVLIMDDSAIAALEHRLPKAIIRDNEILPSTKWFKNCPIQHHTNLGSLLAPHEQPHCLMKTSSFPPFAVWLSDGVSDLYHVFPPWSD
jgi:hypothetical protein